MVLHLFFPYQLSTEIDANASHFWTALWRHQQQPVSTL